MAAIYQDEWATPRLVVSQAFTSENFKKICAENYDEYDRTKDGQKVIGCYVSIGPHTPSFKNAKNGNEKFTVSPFTFNFEIILDLTPEFEKTWSGEKPGLPYLLKLVDRYIGKTTITGYETISKQTGDEWKAKNIEFKFHGYEGLKKSAFEFSWNDCAKTYVRSYYDRDFFSESCTLKNPRMNKWQNWENISQANKTAYSDNIIDVRSNGLTMLPAELIITKNYGPNIYTVDWETVLSNPDHGKLPKMTLYPQGKSACGTGAHPRATKPEENVPSELFKGVFKEMYSRYTSGGKINGYVTDAIQNGNRNDFIYQIYDIKRVYDLLTAACNISTLKFYNGYEEIHCKVDTKIESDTNSLWIESGGLYFITLANGDTLAIRAGANGYTITIGGRNRDFYKLNPQELKSTILQSIKEALGEKPSISVMLGYRKPVN